MPAGAPAALTLADAAAAAGARLVRGDPGRRVSRIALDVRDVRPGDLFAALDGEPGRGHAVAAEAVSRGAGSLLLARDLGLAAPTLVAERPSRAVADLSAALHAQPSRSLRVIGITGTDGKTTTAHLLASILQAAALPAGVVTTVGIRIAGRERPPLGRLTTPEAPDLQHLLREVVDAGGGHAVVEATSHGLALDRLRGVELDVAAVTNVTHEHLDFHGTAAAYREAKAVLFRDLLAAGGTAVVNADDEGSLDVWRRGGRPAALLFGEGDADVRCAEHALGRDESAFLLELPGGTSVPVRLPLPGVFNVANALCAAACAHASGVPPAAIAEGLSAAEPVPGRMQAVEQGQRFAVVVDFAHTPRALRLALEHLRAHRCRGRLVVVVGSAGERDLLKRPLLGEAAALGADLAVFTSEDPRGEEPSAIVEQLAAGARAAGGRDGETFLCLPDRRAAIREALCRARPGDCVLLAGKGHERSLALAGEERPWHEAAIVRELLAELGWGRA